LRVGDALRDQIIDAGHDVFEISAAPIGAIHLDKLVPVTS